jgi:hypothetical protein
MVGRGVFRAVATRMGRWSRALSALLLIAAAMSSKSRAQGTVHTPMIWGGVFGDHRFGTKSALYWDYMPRRTDAGAAWQIQVGSVGYTRDLSPQWRATGALGWSRGSRYGSFPARASTFELRPWLQLTGTRNAGSWFWSDRTRAELRFLRPVGDRAPANADWSPSIVRFRRLDRFQHALSADKRWYGAVSQEFFMNLLPAASQSPLIDQSRTQLLLGRQLTPQHRVESGYGLQYIDRRGGIELNHALLVYLRTAVPLR